MPLFRLWCEPCSTLTMATFPRRPVPTPYCPICKGPREYIVNTGSRIVEIIDTGTMTRPVEQLQDVEKLHRDRADQLQGKTDETVVKLKPE